MSFEEAQRKFDVQKLRREATGKYGVSCWHINEHRVGGYVAALHRRGPGRRHGNPRKPDWKAR